ncbi:MAG: ABC transporter permease [Candidatus Woesearchaeota archaeon]
MIVDYFKFALKNLLRRKLRSWLTLIGIIIGITFVVALIGVGQALQVALGGIFGTLGTDEITISATGGFGPPGSGVVKPLTVSNLNKIQRVSNVDVASGSLVKSGKFEYNKKLSFGYSISMPVDKNERVIVENDLKNEIYQGRLLRASDSRKVLVGYSFKDLTEFFGREITVGSRVLIQDKQFEVIGIIEKQGNFIFDSSVYMNEDDLRDLFNVSSDAYDIITVLIRDENKIQETKKDLERLMRKERNVGEGNEDFTVSTAKDVADSVGSIVGGVNLFVYAIAAISILVGGIGIMNTMFMSVTERTRDIGIMKSVGAKNSTIFGLFFIESGFLGCVGGIVGVILGSIFAIIGTFALEAFLGGAIQIKANINLILIASSVLGSFVVGSIFGIIPAIKASNLHPVDALRHKK